MNKTSSDTSATKTPVHKKKRRRSTASTSSSKSSGTASSSAHTASSRTSRRKRTARSKGQQKIDSDRAQEIQEALIREHYLSGEATGKWNDACEAAMRKYQGDHGWQTKTVPDSRALIALGLGPSHDHLLNPESAMTTGPDASHASALNPPATHAVEENKMPTEATPAADHNTADPQ